MTTQVMTDIEQIVYDWLTARNIPFRFQSALMGGFYQLGGAVVDVIITDRNLAWRIQGEYWHRGVSKTGQDILQREMLNELGYTVVDLLSDDLEDPTRRDETLTKALRGEEMLR